MEIKKLEPQEVFGYFEEILKIPRPSKKEEKIRNYIENFAKRYNLPYKIDAVGNIVVYKKGLKESANSVILQCHLDMVPEKASNSTHNFDTDPIKAYYNEKTNWIEAIDTTLGADDGIGIAIILAILASNDIVHPNIEAVFTVEEEAGMTGAKGFDISLISGNYFINLDSEDEGEIFIGSAGGVDTNATLKFSAVNIPTNHVAVKIVIDKLHGGHSGDEIHVGYANAIKLLIRILYELGQKINFNLSKINGGSLRNAIPKDAYAIITFEPSNYTVFEEIFSKIKHQIFDEYSVLEKTMEIYYEKINLPSTAIDDITKEKILLALNAVYHGVLEWDKSIPNLVQTSTNLAIVRTEDNEIKIYTSQRSSIDSQKKYMSDIVKSAFLLANAEIVHGEPYPGWKPQLDSKLLKIAVDTYKELFNIEPKVKAIHAGLECGLFKEKKPELEIISIGPTIKGAHTPQERVDVESVKKFWLYLIEILKKL